MFASFSGTADFDRNLYQYVVTSGTKNRSGYSNPRLDLILANARKASSPTALKTLYHAAEEILINDRPIIYLYYPSTYAGISDAVTGVNFYSDRLVRADYAQYG
jgi:peptide/nickel transport system substrate-binding protein